MSKSACEVRETTPDAATMLQRMHARAVDRENHGDVPRIGSDEVLAVLRAAQAERRRHAEEVKALRDQLREVTMERENRVAEMRAWGEAKLAGAQHEITHLRDLLREVTAERENRVAEMRAWGEAKLAGAQHEIAHLRSQLREVTAELDGEREHATKMEAELADRRAHDEDVRTCLEYCDEDDPTPGGIGGLARELLKWFSGSVGDPPPIDDPSLCEACGSPVIQLGVLGSRLYLRCTCCGMQTSIPARGFAGAYLPRDNGGGS